MATQGVIAAVFVVACATKVYGRSAFRSFRDAVAGHLPVTDALLTPAAVAIVVLEAAVAVLVLVPGTVTAGLLAAGGLLAGFTLARAHALRHGVRTSCRCFGSASAGDRGALARNGLLIGCVVTGLVAQTAAQQAPASGYRPGGVVVALAAAAVTSILVIFFEEIASVFTGE
jgi:hypothetical protein